MAKRNKEDVPILDDRKEREKGEDPLQFPGDLRPV